MTENEVKHLEFIQSNIARMGQNSFYMKGWALAVLAAVLALYAASVGDNGYGNTVFLYVAVIPTTVFWLLDSYYLQQERKFRGVYNDVAKLSEESTRINIKPFEMPLYKYNGGKYSLTSVIFSITEYPLYLTIIVGLTIAGCVLK